MSSRLGMVAIAATLLGATSAAHGQFTPDWTDPEVRDFDADEEERSGFWERAIHPRRDEFDELVKNAERRMLNNDKQNRAAAEELLREAIALDPEAALAYWLLGDLYAATRRWEECAEARQRIFDRDPDYRPEGRRASAWALDFGLGQCYSRAGNYELAIDHYKRILTTRRATGAFNIRWQLGEALMALGRLGEAISSLQVAAKLSGEREPLVHYALAVAYDRDEKLAASRNHLQLALARDPQLKNLERTDLHFAPAADRWYYLGLAERGRYLPRPERATIYFRRFAVEQGDGAWMRRASHHLAEMAREPLSPTRVVRKGVASIDMKKTIAAITRVDDELQRCAALTPNVLFEVRITNVVRKKTRRGRATPATSSRAGVRTTVAYSFATSADVMSSAIRCIDGVAATITLPAATGVAGEYVDVIFPLVAHP